MRIESLRLLSGTHSYRHLYIRRCARLVHSAQVSHGSLTQSCVSREICAIDGAPTCERKIVEFLFGRVATFLIRPSDIPTYVIDRIRWRAHGYTVSPDPSRVDAATSIYYSNSKEIRRTPAERELTYQFGKSLSWLDAGMRVLRLTGRSPERPRALEASTGREAQPDMFVANSFTGRVSYVPDRHYESGGEIPSATGPGDRGDDFCR